MRSRWLLSGTVAFTTSLALVATLPGSARAVGESSELAVVAVAEARAKSLAEDMARTERLARSQAQAQAAKAKIEDTTSVRIASFNVRTARADRGTSRHWLKRAGSVARTWMGRRPTTAEPGVDGDRRSPPLVRPRTRRDRAAADPDLASLRGHAEFQKLLAAEARPAAPHE